LDKKEIKKERTKLICIALCAVFAVPLTNKWFFMFFNLKKIKENCFSIKIITSL
jgi:hypothetical protein